MSKVYRLLASVVLIFPGGAFAQSFNIDFGLRTGTRPPDSYGAVPGQTGFWNLYSGAANATLTGLDGSVSTVRIDMPLGASNIEIPELMGGEKAMMESIVSDFPALIGTISNLSPGTYDVYLYAWRPASHMATRLDLVGVFNGVTGGETILRASRPWPGMQIEGETYGKFTVDVLAGGPFANTLQFYSQGFVEDSAILNGIQLIRVPAPMSALPLLGFGLWAPRRRRRK